MENEDDTKNTATDHGGNAKDHDKKDKHCGVEKRKSLTNEIIKSDTSESIIPTFSTIQNPNFEFSLPSSIPQSPQNDSFHSSSLSHTNNAAIDINICKMNSTTPFLANADRPSLTPLQAASPTSTILPTSNSSIILKQFESMAEVLSPIPHYIRILKNKNTNKKSDANIEWTAMDANENYIFIGSSNGTLFIFDRKQAVLKRRLFSKVHLCVKHHVIKLT